MQSSLLVSWAELLASLVFGMMLLLLEVLFRAMVVIGFLLYLLVTN